MLICIKNTYILYHQAFCLGLGQLNYFQISLPEKWWSDDMKGWNSTRNFLVLHDWTAGLCSLLSMYIKSASLSSIQLSLGLNYNKMVWIRSWWMRENQLHSILFRIACSIYKYSLVTVKRAVSVRMLAAGNKERPKCVKCNKVLQRF